jgi:hypothetical protein
MITSLIYNGTIQQSTGSYTIGIVCQQAMLASISIVTSQFNTTVTCPVQTGLITNATQTTIFVSATSYNGTISGSQNLSMISWSTQNTVNFSSTISNISTIATNTSSGFIGVSLSDSVTFVSS